MEYYEEILQHQKEEEQMKKIHDTINRKKYAISEFEKNEIPYELKSDEIGHFNLLNDKKVVMSFWARTGRFIFTANANTKMIIDADLDRGIKKCIKTYKKLIEEKK